MSELPTTTDAWERPRSIINPLQVYDITLVTPEIAWSGLFDRFNDPELAEVIDTVVKFLNTRR